jgi:hypothetical protein
MRGTGFALAILAVLVAVASSAQAETYSGCQVGGVAAFKKRTHVRCSQPYSGTTISYFAAPATDRDLASRLMADGLVAQVTGAPLDIYFTLADTSGTSVGCGSSDCRLISGVETSGVGPLVTGTTPGRTAGALAAIVAPEPDASFAALGAGSVLVLLGHRRRGRAERAASQ